MPAVGATVGPVGVAEVDVEELKLELEEKELIVATGVEEAAELLVDEGVLLGRFVLVEVEVLMAEEEMGIDRMLVELLTGVLESLLMLIALELVDNDDELLLGVTVLLAGD